MSWEQMEDRKLSTLPIAPVLRNKLHKAGYGCIRDFKDVNCEQLCKGL